MGCTQVSVNAILTIPEHQPDINSILRISTRAGIDQTITLRKKIFFAGHVDICVEYVACACDNTQQVHLLHTKIPFHGLTFHWCAREHLHAILKAKIIFCENDMISPRKINTILILQLGKPKFRRIIKSYAPQCFNPFHESVCKSTASHCAPSYPLSGCKQQDKCDCKEPDDDHDCSDVPECEQPDSCDCEISPHDSPCKPHHSSEWKPPFHTHDCLPHYSGYCKPPAYDDYAYQTQTHEDYTSYDYVFSDDYHSPTYIQPCKKLGNNHGVTFGFNYEE